MNWASGCPHHIRPGDPVSAVPFDEDRRYIERGTARIEFALNHRNGRMYLYYIGPSEESSR